jgi:hypothetical protein
LYFENENFGGKNIYFAKKVIRLLKIEVRSTKKSKWRAYEKLVTITSLSYLVILFYGLFSILIIEI